MSLTLNPWARPGLRWTSEDWTIAAVVMNSPYKALLFSRTGQGTVEVGGGRGVEGGKGRDRERKSENQRGGG